MNTYVFILLLILIIIVQYLIKKYDQKKETIKNKPLLKSSNSKPVINKSAKPIPTVQVPTECSAKESVNNIRKPSHTRPTINKTVR